MNDVTSKISVSTSITKFCNEFGKCVQGIILYGSYARQTQHMNSDVDILVIDDGFPLGCRIQKVVDGYPIQAVVMSFNELLISIKDAPKKSNPFLPEILLNPVILFDKSGLCKYAINTAKDIVAKGPVMMTDSYLELMRIGIINYMNDGTAEKYTGSRKSEGVVWAAKLLTMLEDYMLAQSGGWLKNNTKYKKIALQEKHSHLRCRLHDTLEGYLLDYDNERYVSNVKSLIDSFMSLDWDTKGQHHAAVV
jgi:hypothetical protein